MLLTPSYHVFDLYAAHQDATWSPSDVQSERYAHAGYDIPAVSASASVGADGKLHLTLSNANPHDDVKVHVFVRGLQADRIEGRSLCGHDERHNTFEQPGVVKPQAFGAVRANAEGLEIVMPKMSVVALDVRQLVYEHKGGKPWRLAFIFCVPPFLEAGQRQPARFAAARKSETWCNIGVDENGAVGAVKGGLRPLILPEGWSSQTKKRPPGRRTRAASAKDEMQVLNVFEDKVADDEVGAAIFYRPCLREVGFDEGDVCGLHLLPRPWRACRRRSLGR